MKKFVEESWLVLLLGIVFAVLLAGTQTSLSARIDANRQKALNEAIAEVVPGTTETQEQEIASRRVFKCLGEGGQSIGWAVQSDGGGFVDKITLVLGFDPELTKVTGMKVIADLETPGLGNKIEGEWAKQYAGMDAGRELTLIKGPAKAENNEISAITGATWSSRYVTGIVNSVLAEVRPELLGNGQ